MSRGVAILFNNTFNYKLLSITKVRTGNTIMLDIKITSSNKKMTLVVVYGPNETNCEFYIFLSKQLLLRENTSVILGGDWNVPQNYTTATNNYVNRNNEKNQKEIVSMIEKFDLVNIWREHNDDKTYLHGTVPTENKLGLIIF